MCRSAPPTRTGCRPRCATTGSAGCGKPTAPTAASNTSAHSNLGDRQLTTTTVAGGGETAELVDQLGRTRERRVKTFDGRIATTYTDYDPLGRGVRRTSRPALPGEAPQYTVTQYDNRGRVTSVTAPDGAQVRHEYLNRETHTYDAKGVHSYTVDTVDGEVDSRYEDDPTPPTGCVTDFEYGPFGETTKIVAAGQAPRRPCTTTRSADRIA